MWKRRLTLALACAIGLGTAACSDKPAQKAVTIGFEPAIAPVVDLQRLPFPNDLYYNADGRLHFVATPETGKFVSDRFLPQLATLNGFGTQQGVYFGLQADNETLRELGLQGVIHANELTATAMIVGPLDAAEPQVWLTEVHFDARLLLLSVTPFLGHPLEPGGRFAAIVDRGALARLLARPVDVAAAFQRAIVDGTPEPGAETRLATAQRADILAAADVAGIPVANLAAATVFSIQVPTADLDTIAEWIDTNPPAAPVVRNEFYGAGLTGAQPLSDMFGTPTDDWPGHDNPGGIVHDHVAYAFTGTMTVTMWSDTFGRAPINRDRDGNPAIYGTQEVEFILTLPDCPQPAAGYPVVIGQHGLGHNKVFVHGVVETMSSECLAMVGIDAVAHGFRSRQPGDDENNLTGEPTPDGLDDGFAFAGIDQIFLINPLVARTNLIETAAGLMQLARAVRLATWILPEGALLPNFKLDGSRIGYIGQSMGAIVGSIFTGTTADIQASVINVGGGNFIRIATESPVFEKLTPAFALGYESDPNIVPDRFYPALSIFQAVLEGADPMNYGPRFTKSPRTGAPRKHVIVQAGHQDQLIPDSSSEGLATAAGYPLLGDNRPHVPLYQ